MEELIERILDNHKYERKVMDNDGTPQVSLDKKGNSIAGIEDEVKVEMRYSSVYDSFYWVVFPPGNQPSPEELEGGPE